MSEHPEQVRLALTVFDELERLWSTVLALAQQGLHGNQLCLVATAATMKDVSLPENFALHQSERSLLLKLCEAVEPWVGAINGLQIIATSGPLLDALRQDQPSEHNAPPKLRVFTGKGLGLAEDIGNGAIVLVVRSFNAKQQLHVTRALLSRSVHMVTTHEFVLPA